MSSRGTGKTGQPLYDRLWGSGFLPSKHQGVKFRNQGDPVLDISDPAGISRNQRRVMLDSLKQLNQLKFSEVNDPEIETRIAQYELAYRMQMSVPDLLDFSDEPKHVMDLYGSEVTKPGRYAYNCLVARRLAERGVRFIQLFSSRLGPTTTIFPLRLENNARTQTNPPQHCYVTSSNEGCWTTRLSSGVANLAETIYSQGKLTAKSYGRDHHPSCFSMWMAGGGTQGGVNHGSTDDYSVNVAEDGVSVHDLHATVLHLLGIDHERFDPQVPRPGFPTHRCAWQRSTTITCLEENWQCVHLFGY